MHDREAYNEIIMPEKHRHMSLWPKTFGCLCYLAPIMAVICEITGGNVTDVIIMRAL